jgi:rSAM/selenodomain-associated transferase 2
VEPVSAPKANKERASLTFVVPVLNEASSISTFITSLRAGCTEPCEIIVVDGGSDDRTAELARPESDLVIVSQRGRAIQMNAGAQKASGTMLCFVHADSTLPPEADQAIRNALLPGKRHWGRFDVRLSGRQPLLRVVERMMNTRSRLTGICTGDQAMFMTRELFDTAGGFPEIALMEDIALSRTLRSHSRPACLHQKLVTSSRRWENQGILRTIVLMWKLRLLYFLGADPARLARRYYGHED